MTNHNNPIDRALERLVEQGIVHRGQIGPDRVTRLILTDLAAEIKAEHPCHGETKPQQSPASDGGLDEIEAARLSAILPLKNKYLGNDLTLLEALAMAWDAGVIRARETDPRFQFGGRMNATETGNLYTRMVDAERKLAAVRAYNARCRKRNEYPDPVHLDAIARGEGGEQNDAKD